MILEFIRSVRQNHALEHATVALLLAKLPPGARLLGRAASDGFYIYGDVPEEALAEAVEQALARLNRGEHALAVSSMCGTNLATTGVLAGLASMLALRGKSRLSQLPNVLLASVAAAVVAQPLGRIVQERFTVTAEVSDLIIAGIESRGSGPRTRHKIKTLRHRPSYMNESESQSPRQFRTD